MSSVAYSALKYLLALVFLGVGALYLSTLYGDKVYTAVGRPFGPVVFAFPDQMRFVVVAGKKIDKLGAGAKLIGLPFEQFVLLIGASKFAAGFAFLTDALGLETLATVLAIVLEIAAAAGHTQIDNDVAGPLVLGGLLVLKLFLRPSRAVAAVEKKTH